MRRKVRNKKTYTRVRRHMRVRNKVQGSGERPRACVFRSNTHIYAQIIDDDTGNTIASASSLKIDPKSVKSSDKKKKTSKKIALAHEVGKQLAAAAKEKGVSKVSFDRGGYIYHGRVAAVAEGLRSGGLEL